MIELVIVDSKLVRYWQRDKLYEGDENYEFELVENIFANYIDSNNKILAKAGLGFYGSIMALWNCFG